MLNHNSLINFPRFQFQLCKISTFNQTFKLKQQKNHEYNLFIYLLWRFCHNEAQNKKKKHRMINPFSLGGRGSK